MRREWRKGDEVTATGVVVEDTTANSKYVPILLTGSETWDYIEPRALTLVAPVEPPVGSVVVALDEEHGTRRAWTRWATLDRPVQVKQWDSPKPGAEGESDYADWTDICHGAVIFIPGGEA